MSKHSLVRPFSTSASNHLDDYTKRYGRQIDVWQWWWIRVLYSDYSDADTSQSLDLADLATALMASASGAGRCSGILPTDALFGYWNADLREVFDGTGVSAAAMILGPEGVDDNGFMTTTNVTTGASLGRKQTAAAALWTPQPLAANPALQLDTTGNINLLETGCIDIYARFTLNPASQAFNG